MLGDGGGGSVLGAGGVDMLGGGGGDVRGEAAEGILSGGVRM